MKALLARRIDVRTKLRGRLLNGLCRCALHRYGSDEEVGCPYQRCRWCGKLGINRPPSSSVALRHL